MPDQELVIRPLEDTDIEGIIELDEKVSGEYRPETWEGRLGYYLRRDPDASRIAELDGRVVGFMLGEVRSGEFGLEEATGWIEVLGVDPDVRGQAIGRRLFESLVEVFRERGAKGVRTLVDEEMGDLAAFFSALGFSPVRIQAFHFEL